MHDPKPGDFVNGDGLVFVYDAFDESSNGLSVSRYFLDQNQNGCWRNVPLESARAEIEKRGLRLTTRDIAIATKLGISLYDEKAEDKSPARSTDSPTKSDSGANGWDRAIAKHSDSAESKSVPVQPVAKQHEGSRRRDASREQPEATGQQMSDSWRQAVERVKNAAQ